MRLRTQQNGATAIRTRLEIGVERCFKSVYACFNDTQRHRKGRSGKAAAKAGTMAPSRDARDKLNDNPSVTFVFADPKRNVHLFILT